MSNNDLLVRTTFYPGFVTNGVVSYDANEIRGKYSDLIKLEAGKTYQIDEIPVGISFKELLDYLLSFDKEKTK